MPRNRGRSSGLRKGRRKSGTGVELEKFTTADLRTWQRQSENLEKYHVQLYYHLEGLRSLHNSKICEALWRSKPAEIELDKWARIVDYRYSLQPLSATGSLVHGGRFNIGYDLDPSKFPVFPALYIAENYQTAYDERFGRLPQSHSTIKGHELALREPNSFTSVNVSGKISNLFDLRSISNIRSFAAIISKFEIPTEMKLLARTLGISGPLLVSKASHLQMTLLAHNWRIYPSQYEIPANPQAFGRLLLEANFDGILYPSTKGPENCIALFPTNFAESESFVEVADVAPPGATQVRLDATTWMDLSAPPSG